MTTAKNWLTINIMQKKFIAVILSALILALLNQQVLAESPRRFYDWSSTFETKDFPVLGTSTATEEGKLVYRYPQQYIKFTSYIFGGSLGPDSPFYFLKTTQENIRLGLTFDPKKKQEMRLKIAGQRLSEIQSMIQKGNYDKLATVVTEYKKLTSQIKDEFIKLKSKNVEISSFLALADDEGSKHALIIEEIKTKLSPENQTSITQAADATAEIIDTVADLENRPSVPKDVSDRIQSLKAQGILTPEEAAKIINAKSRSEARGELKKFVNEGIFPEADYLKLDEKAKELYSQDFFKIHEVKRFYEIKRLEEEKPDEATQKRVQAFAKDYKPGDIVPADIKKYWVHLIRKDELDNTFRPDLIDKNVFEQNEDRDKYNELIERYKPGKEDLVSLNKYSEKNPGSSLPPEYERIKTLSEKLGTSQATNEALINKSISCPSNTHFVSYQNVPEGGYCIPNFTSNPSTQTPGDYPSPIYPPAVLTPSPTSTPSPTPTNLNYPPYYPPTDRPTPWPQPTLSPTPTINPPTAYGNCPSGQVWNGYICIVYPPFTPTQSPQLSPTPQPTYTPYPTYTYPTYYPTSQPPTSTPAPGSNSQTHSNPEGLYTIQLPIGWTIEHAPGSSDNHSWFYFWNQSKPSITSACGTNDLLKNGLVKGVLEIAPLYYYRAGGATTVTEQDFYKGDSDSWFKSGEYTQFTNTETTVGGQRAMLQIKQQIKIAENYPCVEDLNQITKKYYIFIGSRLGKKTWDNKPLNEAIVISITYDIRNPSKDAVLQAFDQMLSSFKMK